MAVPKRKTSRMKRGFRRSADALKHAKGSVKLAVLLLDGCSVTEANTLLERTGGQLRAALELARKKSGRESHELKDVTSPSFVDDALLNDR